MWELKFCKIYTKQSANNISESIKCESMANAMYALRTDFS